MISGPAAADPWLEEGECGDVDQFLKIVSFNNLNQHCVLTSSEQITEMKQLDAEQTELDIYEGAVATRSNERAFLDLNGNYMMDTESVAYSKARAAIAEEYESGGTEDEAHLAAKQAINDYYSQKQLQMVAKWNITVSEVEYLANTSAMETGIQDDYIYNEFAYSTPYRHAIYDFNTTTVELVNGTEVTIKTLWAGRSAPDPTAEGRYMTPESGVGWEDNTADYNGLFVRPPMSDYDHRMVMNFTKWKNQWTGIETRSDRLIANADVLVNNTYPALQNGTLAPSDVVDSSTISQEYATRYNDSGYYVHAYAAIAGSGMEYVDLNTTATMTLQTSDGKTYEGLLAARDAPAGDTLSGKRTTPLTTMVRSYS
ncbi:hypothetical protein ACFQH6_15105 [Halobacteriaceae archaeon GCM10025711]